jgi:predicted transposase YdaD
MKTLTQHLMETSVAKKWRTEWLAEGRAEGRTEERAARDKELHADRVSKANELKRRGLDDETIMIATGLSLSEVKQLKIPASGKISRKKSK